MTKDEDVFMDILQEIIDDLKNAPKRTAVIAVIVKTDKTVVFKHADERMDIMLTKKLIDVVSGMKTDQTTPL